MLGKRIKMGHYINVNKLKWKGGRLKREKIYVYLRLIGASLVAQLVKNPPTIWETWVRSLGWEDPLEEGMAIHSSIFA